MNTTKTLVFTTELKSISGIQIDGKPYVLSELTGTERDQYQTKGAGRIKFEKGEMAGMKDMDGVQAELLALSLRNPDGTKAFSVAQLQKWPASTLSVLYKEARELSGLGKEEEETAKAKNDSPASASPGSDSPESSAAPSASAKQE